MMNAIGCCTAFYEPPERSAADEDFAEEEDPGTRIDALLAGEVTPETILSAEALRLAAWAYGNDMLRYTRIRQAGRKRSGQDALRRR